MVLPLLIPGNRFATMNFFPRMKPCNARSVIHITLFALVSLVLLPAKHCTNVQIAKNRLIILNVTNERGFKYWLRLCSKKITFQTIINLFFNWKYENISDNIPENYLIFQCFCFIELRKVTSNS